MGKGKRAYYLARYEMALKMGDKVRAEKYGNLAELLPMEATNG